MGRSLPSHASALTATGPVPAAVARWYGRLPRPYQTKRLLRLLHIAEVRWLRPSYSSARDMIALALPGGRGGA